MKNILSFQVIVSYLENKIMSEMGYIGMGKMANYR